MKPPAKTKNKPDPLDPDDVLKGDPTTGVKNKVDTEPTIHEEDDSFATVDDQIDYIVGYDYSDEDDLKEELDAARNELNEALTMNDRLKRKSTMRRFRSKIENKRDRAMTKRASSGTAMKRARRKAIDIMKKRFTKAQDINELPASEKARIEKLVSKRKNAVDRMAKRLVRGVRKAEQTRLMNNSVEMDPDVNELFESYISLHDV